MLDSIDLVVRLPEPKESERIGISFRGGHVKLRVDGGVVPHFDPRAALKHRHRLLLVNFKGLPGDNVGGNAFRSTFLRKSPEAEPGVLQAANERRNNAKVSQPALPQKEP